jgi:hypothetical protein
MKISGFASIVGRRMLVPETMFQGQIVKSFQTTKRSNMIYFAFPFEEHDDIKMTAPAGYTIETVPAALKIDPGAVSYQITASQQGGSVEVKRQLVVSAMLIPLQAYPALRQFFNSVKSNDEAQVVFQNSQHAQNN